MRRSRPTPLIKLLVAASLLCAAASARAQPITLPEAVRPADMPGFLTRSKFSLMLGLLGSTDARFTATGGLNADVDVADYETGRVNLYIDYEGILGSERHSFDLNHGNYHMEVSASRRFGELEVSGVFHHVSRHLSDREHSGSISWNVFGGRALRQWRAGKSTIDGQADFGYVHEPHFVDYTFTGALAAAVRRPLNDRVGIYGGARGELMTVDHDVRDHGPCGARLEGGLRVLGPGARLEVFAAYERRVDGYPTELNRVRFSTLGIRLSNR